mmetsp:Transcript_4337/g.13949  ORF Transcript_4337/g.13949 Transcript_4337/m.13949 type:complete len:267 (+) Transcript_4337:461-1261(+)
MTPPWICRPCLSARRASNSSYPGTFCSTSRSTGFPCSERVMRLEQPLYTSSGTVGMELLSRLSLLRRVRAPRARGMAVRELSAASTSSRAPQSPSDAGSSVSLLLDTARNVSLIRELMEVGRDVRELPFTESFSSLESWESAGGSEESALLSRMRILRLVSCPSALGRLGRRLEESTRRVILVQSPMDGGRKVMALLWASRFFTAGPRSSADPGISLMFPSLRDTIPVALQVLARLSLFFERLLTPRCSAPEASLPMQHPMATGEQ